MTPPNNISGAFRLVFNARSVMSDGASTNNSPLNPAYSSFVSVDTRPIIVARALWTSISGGTRLVGVISFLDAAVYDVTSSAFRVQNSVGRDQTDWNISVSTSAAFPNGRITVTATPRRTNKRGAFRLKINASSIKSGGSRTPNAPGSNTVSGYASINNIPARIATATWKTISGGEALKGTITFHNAIVTGIQNTDFEILNSSNVVQQDARGNSTWEISVSSSFAFPETTTRDSDVVPTGRGTVITVDANPPASTNGSFKIRLKARSVMSDGVSTNNSPASAVTSGSAPVNNSIIIANMAWSHLSVSTGTIRLSARLTFTQASVTGIEASDFKVVDRNGTEYNWPIVVNVLPTDTVNANGFITVTATPPTSPPVNGDFGLVVKMNKIKSGGSSADNAPLADIPSDTTGVNTTPAPPERTYKVATASWNNISGTTGGTKVKVYYARSSNSLDLTDDIKNQINTITTDSQTFWADQMEAHGYGRQTFDLTLGSDNKVEITKLNLTDDEAVDGNAFTNKLNQVANQNPGIINLIFLPRDFGGSGLGFASLGSSNYMGNSRSGGRPGVGELSVIYYRGWSRATVAHEIGHNLSLIHEDGDGGPGDTIGEIRRDGIMRNAQLNYLTVKSAAIVNSTGYLGTSTMTPGSTLSTSDTSITGNLSFFVANIRELGPTDIDVLDADNSDAVDDDWSITLSKTSVNANSFSAVTATPVTSKNGNFKLRLNAGSVKSDGSPRDNAPSVNVISDPITFSSQVTIEVESFTALTGIQEGTHSLFILTLEESVPVGQITKGDFDTPDNIGVSHVNVTEAATASGSTDTFFIFVTNPTNSVGKYIITLKADSIDGTADYGQGPENPEPSTEVSYDTRTISWSTPVYNRTTRVLSANLTFSQAVDGLHGSDIEVIDNSSPVVVQTWPISLLGGTVSAVANTDIPIAVTVPTNTNGTFAFRLKANSVQLGTTTENNAPELAVVSPYLAIDNRTSIVPAIATWSNMAGGTTLTGRITFDQTGIIDLSTTDFEVVDFRNNPTDPAWRISYRIFDLPTTYYAELTARPPTGTIVQARYKLKLKMLSVRGTGQSVNNAPAADVISLSELVNNRPTVAVKSFKAPTGIQTGTRSRFVLELDRNVPISEVDRNDFEIPNDTSIFQVNPPLVSFITRQSDEWFVFINNPVNKNGTYTIKFKKDAVSSGTDYLKGPTATYTSDPVIFDTREIRWDIPNYNATTRVLSANIQFSQAVDGLHGSDIDVIDNSNPPVIQSWTISLLGGTVSAAANTNIPIPVVVPTNTNGTFSFRLRPLTVELGTTTVNNAPTAAVISPTIDIDNRTGITTVTAGWARLSGGSSLRGRVLFNMTTVREVDPAAFEVLDINNEKQNNWTITYSHPAVPVYYVDVTATPNSGNIVNADFKLRILKKSVKSGGSTTFNSPTIDVISGTMANVDTRHDLTVSSFIAPTGVQRGPKSVFKLTLNREVDRFAVCATHFTPQGGSGAVIDSVNVTETTGSMSDKFDVVVINPVNGSGAYFIRMNEDAIDGTDTVKPGPPSSPVADRQSNTVGYNTTGSGITATWGSVSLSDRVATSRITFSSNPGSSFNVGFDVLIQKKNGTTYTNEPKTSWTRTSTAVPGQPTQRTIVADPSPSVEAGTYRFILVTNALGTGTGGETSNDFTIGEEMAIPAATINNGFFDPDTDTVRFYVSWTNVTTAQLTSFTNADIEVKDASTGLDVMGVTSTTVQSADGNTFPVDILLGTNISGSLYIRIRENAITGTTSYATRSSPVSYNTIPMTTPSRVTFEFTGVYAADRGGSPITNFNRGSIYVEISSGGTNISDFTQSDIIVSGGCSAGLTPASGSANRWRLRIDITNETAGRINLFIPENTIGNGNNAVQTSYAYDRRSSIPATAATPHINGPWTTAGGSTSVPLTDGRITATSFYVTILFDRSGIEGFDADDIMVVNACKGTFRPIRPGISWSLQIATQAGFDGNVNVLIPSGITTQSGSNVAVSATYGVRRPSSGITASPATFTIGEVYDNREPEASGTLQLSPAVLEAATVYIDITCNKVVSDFTVEDINIGNGCVGQLHATTMGANRGRRWTLQVGLKEGTAGFMDINIPPNVVRIGNPNASKEFEYSRSDADAEAATISIGGAYTQSGNPARGSLITGTINTTNNSAESFWVPIQVRPGASSNPVMGFGLSDVTVYGACKGSDFIETTSGSNQWNVHVDPDDNFKGWITVAVAANVTTQSGGNTPDSRSFYVDYSTSSTTENPTTFTIHSAYDMATGGSVVSDGSLAVDDATIYVHIRSTRAVDDFDGTDINISNGCKGGLTVLSGSGITPNTEWRIEVGLTNETTGRMTVSIPPNVVNYGNANVSKSFPYDRISEVGDPFPVNIGTPRTSSTGNTVIPNYPSEAIDEEEFYVPIIFEEPLGTTRITGFTKDDIVVTNACKGELTERGTSGRSFLLHIDNLDDFEGVVNISVPSNVIGSLGSSAEARQLFRKGNIAANASYNVDTTVTTTKTIFTIGAAYANQSGGSALSLPLDEATVHIHITSSVRVSDFTTDEIFVSGGCVGTLRPLATPTGSAWRLEISITDDTEGTLRISIPPNVVSVGNDAKSRDFTYDRTEETGDPMLVSIDMNAKTGSSGNTNTRLTDGNITSTDFYAHITFGSGLETARVTGFTKDDVVVTNACKGDLTTYGTSGRVFRLHVDNLDDFEGVVNVSIPSDVIGNPYADTASRRLARRGNLAANQSFNVDTVIDLVPTRFTIGASTRSIGGVAQSQPFGIATVLIQIDSTLPVTDFDINDIIVAGGCVGTLQHIIPNNGVANTRWFLHMGIPEGESGTIRISILENSVRIGNIAVSEIFRYDRTTTATGAAVPELRDARANSDGTGVIPLTDGKITRQTMYIPIAFSGMLTINGFTDSDISITNACKGTLVRSGTSGRLFLLQVSNLSNFDGIVTVTVLSNSTTQRGSNVGISRNYPVNTATGTTAQAKTKFTIKEVYDAATGGSKISEPLDESPVFVEIESSLSVTDFTAGDINVSGAYPVGLSSITAGTLWRLQLTITDETAGTIIITIPANIVSVGNDIEIQSFAYNRVDSGNKARPTLHTARTALAGTTAVSQPIKSGEFYVPITFDGTQNITGFTKDDIQVINACKGDLTPKSSTALTGSEFPSGRSFILHIDNNDDFSGTVTVTVLADITSQSGSNTSASRNYTVDTVIEAPAPPDETVFTITNAYGMETGGTKLNEPITAGTVYVEIESTQMVSDFTTGDINVSGAYPVDLKSITTGRLWRLQLTITDQTAGTMIITIPADVVSIGNNLAIQSFAYNRVTPGDKARPTLLTARSSTAATSELSQPIRAGDFYVPITFDGTQNIEGFTKDDIQVINACKGELTEKSSTALTGSEFPSGRSFILHIDNQDNFNGTVTVTVLANTTTQSGGNVSASRNYTVDTVQAPTTLATEFTIGNAYDMNMGGSVLSRGDDILNSRTIEVATVHVHITSTQPLDNFTKDDIVVSGGCKGTLTEQTGVPDNTQWRLEISLTADTAGILTISIPANVVDVGNPLEEKQFKYDRLITEQDSPHLRVISGLPTDQVTDRRIITLTLQSYLGDQLTNIDGLTADDIVITSDDDDVIHRLS